MGTRPPRLSSIAVAVAFALSVFGFTLFVWLSFGGGIPLKPQGYRLHVVFGAEAAQLAPNADVRISGVPVGKVAGVSRSPRGTNAEIELEPRYVPLPADARAIIRTKTLIGESYVELTPGTRSGPRLGEGGTLPRSQVEPVQALDEVLGAFDPPTRRSLALFLDGLSTALDDRGQDVNDALGNAPVTVDELSQVVEILDRQQPAVRGLVRNAGTALRTVGRRSDEVRSLVIDGDRLLGATAARDRHLSATVRELAPFLTELRATLREVSATADDAAPTLRALRPVAPLIRPALEETRLLAPEVEGLFEDLRRVIGPARRGLRAATRVVDAARPLVGELDPAGRELVPVVKMLGAYRRELIAFLANVAASMQGEMVLPDGFRQHYVRVLPPIWNEGFVGYEERLPSNRYNPYLRPGALEKLARGGLRAFDCRNTDNPQTAPVLGSAPPCLEQRPWTFRGDRRSFPHVKRNDG